MTEPVDFDPETAEPVTLNGKVWPVPKLAWCSLKKCRKELFELTWLINEVIAAKASPDNLSALSKVFQGLSNDDFDRLVMGPIHAGLTALHPALTREELESWPISEGDRQLAWMTVRRQSDMFVSRGGGEDGNPGEAGGAPRSPN